MGPYNSILFRSKRENLFLGSQWSQKVAGKMKNLFWKDVNTGLE